MNRGMKIAIAIVMDMLFIVAIVYAVAIIIRGTDAPWMSNLAKTVIVILIPCMFYMSFMTFSGDRYDRLPDDLLDDGDEEIQAESQSGNSLDDDIQIEQKKSE